MSFQSVQSLSRYLGVSLEEMKYLSENAVREYRPFPVRSGKKVRRIDNPSKRLKKVQRKIYRKLLRSYEFEPDIHGGVRGRDPKTNAAQHVAKRCVVRIDIKSFFPTITAAQIFDVWFRKLNFGRKAASLLTALTSFRGRLPQGSPASTALANLVLLDGDCKIRQALTDADLEVETRYGRYVDDLNISGDDVSHTIQQVIRILHDHGFSVSRSKIDLLYGHRCQEVTGLTVNHPRGPSVRRSKRDRVRQVIHRLKFTLEGKERKRLVQSCEGHIRHIERTNPGSARRLSTYLKRVVGALRTD